MGQAYILWVYREFNRQSFLPSETYKPSREAIWGKHTPDKGSLPNQNFHD